MYNITSDMKQEAKALLPTGIFLGLAALFAYVELPEIATCSAWLGGIRLLNRAAPRLPFSKTIHWLHAMTFEIPAFLGVAIMRLIPTKETVRGKGQPILLVHGYMNDSTVWRIPKKRLEAMGLGPIYTISLGHPFRSIRSYAGKVKEKAEKIAEETGRKDLILIGHSMGGLVSAWYATQIAPKGTVTDVITIVAPLHGTPMAHIGLGPNAREMEPNSELIQELLAALADNRDTKFHHIATETDQLVVPGRSGVIPQHNHFIFDDIGHASMLYSQRVTDKIATWIQEA